MTQITELLTTPLISAREAADILGISQIALGQERYEGRGPSYVMVGKTVRYRRDLVELYKEARESSEHISAPELAELLGVNLQRLLELSESGKFIRGQIQGRTRVYRAKDVAALLAL